ncbi:pentapeptide repeat-containing protein [Mycobacterium sp.]|uniref:pentapeptide repeat-containing protein n=1 Tax=Mycobacterium sp. TaxID=1785 RepID=UPI003F98C265
MGWTGFRWARLRRTWLRRSRLRWPRLRRARLGRTWLRWARLRWARLRRARLRWARLRWAPQAGSDRHRSIAARRAGERRADCAARFRGDRGRFHSSAGGRRARYRTTGRPRLRDGQRRGGHPDRAGHECVGVEGHQQ